MYVCLYRSKPIVKSLARHIHTDHPVRHHPLHTKVTQWLMTLLAYCLPVRVLVRMWDIVFLDGWKSLFRICLALLEAVEEDLLPLNLEESGR